MKNTLYLTLLALSVVIVSIFSCVYLTSNLNKPARYAIYMGPSQIVSGESTVILLDVESGKSWALAEHAWHPIARTGGEKTFISPDAALQKVLLEDEANRAKKAQERDFRPLRSRSIPRVRISRPKPAASPVKKEKSAPDNDLPPDWL